MIRDNHTINLIHVNPADASKLEVNLFATPACSAFFELVLPYGHDN